LKISDISENQVSDQIAVLKKDKEDASSLISEMKTVSKRNKEDGGRFTRDSRGIE